MAWKSLSISSRLNNLPLVLVGQILSKVKKNSVSVFIFLIFIPFIMSCIHFKYDSFNFDNRDKKASIIGRWIMIESVEKGVAFIDVNNRSNAIKNNFEFVNRTKGKITQNDSLKMLENDELFCTNIDDYYLSFHSDGKVTAGLIWIINDSLQKNKNEGFYEIDLDKLRIEMSYNVIGPSAGGTFHWYRYKDLLRLYPRYLKDKNTYLTYKLKNK